MKETIFGLIALISTVVVPASLTVESAISPVAETQVLAQHELDLTNRLLASPTGGPVEYGSQVFADNILLSLHYLKGDVEKPLDWDKIREPFEVSFTLEPGEVFAFHSNSLPEFEPSVTMNSQFFMEEGYKSLAGLGGNGVCHLASLINWTAQEAGLEVTAKANHSFAPIPGVPKEFGTSIRSQSSNQNLYIENNQDVPVTFEFKTDNQKVVLRIIK